MTAAIVSLVDVHKTYREGDQENHVLRGVSLTIGEGELVAVMGSSGSGNLLPVLSQTNPLSEAYRINNAGQIVGKTWMVLLSIPFVAWLRRRDERLGIMPA